jgi:hypothetical protein
VLKELILSPSLKRLKKVKMITIPTNATKDPLLEIMDRDFNMIWTDNQNYKGPDKVKVVAKHTIKTTGANDEWIEIFIDHKGVQVFGDL